MRYEAMTGLSGEQLTELVARVHAARGGGFACRGRLFALGLFGSIALVVCLMPTNVTGRERLDSRPCRGLPPRGAELPGESARWRGRWCSALSWGKHGSKLAARGEAELGEHLSQVVGDGSAADEQLRGDLGVGGAVAGEAGDHRFLRGKGIPCLDGVFVRVAAACP